MAVLRKVVPVALLWLAWMAGPVAAETLVVCSAATDKTLVVFRFDPTRGSLTELSRQVLPGEPAALLPSPDGRTLFVALRSTGQLTSLSVDGSTGKLTPLRLVNAGADPAQITLDKNGPYLLTAYYEACKISAHRVSAEGKVSVNAEWERPTGEKAHAVTFDRTGRLMVVPTGPNTIFHLGYVSDGLLRGDFERLDLPPKTGPRHATWHPKHPIVYINNEQGSSVSAYYANPYGSGFQLPGLQLIEGSTVSTLPDGFQGENSTAEIALHGDGRTLVVSNRGHDSLALIRVDESGTKLTPLGHHKTEKTPRSFCFDPLGRYVFTAGESSGYLEVSKIMAARENGAAESLKPLGRVRVGDRLWCVTAFEAPAANAVASPDSLTQTKASPKPAADHRGYPVGIWFFIGVLLIGSLWTLFSYHKRLRLARLMEDLPTSKARGVFIGLVQVEGTAEAKKPFATHFEGKLCVYHSWSVSEEWTREVTVTKTDSDGKTYTETKTESGWTTLANGKGSAPFFLKDDSGTVRVCPDGAEIEPKTVFNVTCGEENDLYFGFGPQGYIPNSTYRRNFKEVAIPLHASITVVGQARVRKKVAAPEIAADKSAPLFLISTRTEKQILNSFGWDRIKFLVLGSVLVTVGMFFWQLLWKIGTDQPVFSPWVFATGLAAFWFMALVIYAWQMFNSMVELRNRTDRAWSLIDIELKRRANLIPPLIALVKGINAHERRVQEAVARLRAQANASAKGRVKGLSGGLTALAEAYPQLTANQNSANLIAALTDTENRISMAREYFNDQVVWHNIRVERIPDFLLARLAGLKKRHPFLATGMERKKVEVKLHE